MATKKVGTLIKEARMNADLTQEQLARKVTGASASDISLAERDKIELTQAQLKQIAKATGVTQASLLNAAKDTTTKKSTTAKKSTSTKKSASGKTSMQVTAAEKKLVELYRKADADARKDAVNALKGDDDDISSILENILDVVQDMLKD